MYCTRCGNLANNKRFCTQCGVKLKKAPTSVADPESIFFRKTLQETLQIQTVDPLVGRTIDTRYRLESRIGAGGMGAVYRARRLHIGDEAAIKILNPEQAADPKAVERFQREAKVGAGLRHPNAVMVYDFGVSEDKLIYFVMELVQGDDLRSLILRKGQMSQNQAVEILVQVCAAIEEAHRKGVVHRDLKPENIIVQSTPAGLCVKVLDFGIAALGAAAVDRLTQNGGVVGTPHYMSPEQCMGEDVDGRSDIYSLGIILFEMLAGSVPFNSTTPTAIAVQQVKNAPPSLRDLNPSVSPEVEAVVMRALGKSPEDRPQTAFALAEELLAALNGGRTSSVVSSAVARGASIAPSKRNSWKGRTAGVVALCSILLIANVAGFGLWRNLKKEGNSEPLSTSIVSPSDPAPAPSPETKPEIKLDQPVNSNPENSVEAPAPNAAKETAVQAAGKKVVATKKPISSVNRQAVSKKPVNPEKENIGGYRDRPILVGIEDRSGRFRFNSFGSDDEGRVCMRRRNRRYDR